MLQKATNLTLSKHNAGSLQPHAAFGPEAIMTQEAVDLKNKGNKAFASGDWPTAIDFYSKAIDLHSTEPTFYTNRAQVRPAWQREQTIV